MVVLFYLVAYSIGVALYITFLMFGEVEINTTLVYHQVNNAGLIALALSNIVILIALPRAENGFIKKHIKEFDAKDLAGIKNKTIGNITEEMCIAAGLAEDLKVYIIESLMPNAYAMSQPNGRSAIFLTTRLLEILDRNELQAVIAHEISHIKNKDANYLTRAFLFVALLNCLSGSDKNNSGGQVRVRSRYGGGGGRRGGAIPPHLLIILLIALIIIFVVGPILSKLIYYSISRKREFLADACAVQYTRYPDGLINALAKIEHFYTNESDSRLYTQIGERQKTYDAFYFFSILSFFTDKKHHCTHPATKNRIDVLKKMGGSGLGDYQDAYKKATGKGLFKNLDIQELMHQDVMVPQTSPEDIAAKLPAGIMLAGAALSEDFKNKIVNKQEINDLRAEINGYITIECDCDTRIKFPDLYKGREMYCPHCLKKHIVEEQENIGENELSKLQ